MKFNVKHIGKQGGRIGCIAFKQGYESSNLAFGTPLCLSYTKGGLVPHLIPEVLERLGDSAPAIFQAPLASLVVLQPVLEEYSKGYSKFAGIQGVVYACNQDPTVATPSGYNDKQGIAVWPRAGKRQLDAEKFLRLQAAVRPDWLELLCDSDTPPNASKKRQRKSLDRTIELIEECLKLKADYKELSDTAVLVPLVGGHVTSDRQRAAEAVAASTTSALAGGNSAGAHVHGYVLEALADGPDTGALPTCIENIEHLVDASLAPVDETLPRVVHGPWRPLHVLRLVMRGVDMFDSSYPCLVTERSAGLVFPLINSVSGDSTQLDELPEMDRPESPESRLLRHEGDPVGNQLSAAYEIFLGDPRYREDTAPLVKGCGCYTCQHHSRAYIHHLVTVRELLASVLLQLHNQHHWSGFFASVRSAIVGGALPTLAAKYSRLERRAAAAGGGGGPPAADSLPGSPELRRPRRRKLSPAAAAAAATRERGGQAAS